MSQTTTPRFCSLAIAGLHVTLVCEDAALMARLRRRYRAFLCSGSAQLVLRLGWEPRQQTPDACSVPISFVAGRLRCSGPGYAGWIDAAAGLAELQLWVGQPLAEIDYVLRLAYALLACDAGGMLCHAAAVVRGQRAHLFCGPSGSGKSTVARLSDSDVVLNDDLVLLRPAAEGWLAHATPFWNRPRRRPPVVACAPLAGIYRLVQDRASYLEPLPAALATAELLASIPVLPGDPGRAGMLLQRCRQLLTQVPLYRLHFLPNAGFWALIAPPADAAGTG